MASELKFEFLQRWSQLGRLLFQNPTPEQLQFIQLHEERDRDEEDYLNTLGTGGTAQSILYTAEAVHEETFSSRPNLTATYDDFSIPCPDDPAFNYYVKWSVSGNTKIDKTLDFEFSGTAQILGNTPGAGFEHWGWINTVNAAPTLSGALPSVGSYQASSGHASRTERVPPGLLGTNLSIRTQISSFYSAYTTPYVTTYVSATLIAIPS